MKFRVNVKELASKLSVLAKVVTSNNVIPMLGNFVFSVLGNYLALKSSDSEITIVTSIEVQSDGDALFTCPTRLILDLIKEVKDESIEFEIDENHVYINSSNGRYSLMSLDGNDFPASPEMKEPVEVSVPYESFKQGIARTLFAVADDPLRPQLNGVYIETIGNTIGFASTDAYKVSWVVGEIPESPEVGLIISAKTASLLNSIVVKDAVRIRMTVSAINAMFEIGEYTIYTRLVEGKYPNFKRIVPTGKMSVVTVDKKNLLGAIKRASVFANLSNGLIRMKIGENIIVSSQDPEDKKSARETVNCDYDGEPMEIGFNKNFLIAVITNIESDNVVMSITAPSKAVLFNYEHVKLILMPLMIN